ncbi:MAG: phosphatase PAP2 family protein [Mycobacteriales bacterium]
MDTSRPGIGPVAAALPDPPKRQFAAAAQRLRRALRSRTTTLRWWHEVLLVAVGYGIYSLIRDGVPAQESMAVVRALDIIRIERSLHVFDELSFNHWVANHKLLAEIFDYYYATAHFVVTIAVGIWVLRRHGQHARPLRIAWYGTNLIALVGFAVFPMAPPRLTTGAGFIDTLVIFHTWGSFGSNSVDSVSNQYAAMPSLHIGWALWCATVIVVLARRRWVKLLGIAYPLATLAVIVGTGNHFLLDAFAGGLTTLGGFGIQRLVTGGPAFGGPERQRRARRAAAAAAVSSLDDRAVRPASTERAASRYPDPGP